MLTDCKEYWGTRHHSGYGLRCFRGKTMLAHRAAYIEANGPIPKGMHILHKCDNPPCVNPDHLWAGTQSDNMRDMWRKGRGMSGDVAGEKNPSSVLTEKSVRELRKRRAGGKTYTELGAIFGVDRMTAWHAATGRTWKHVNP